MNSFIRKKMAPAGLAAFIKIVCGTLRISEHPGDFSRIHGENSQPFIAVFWHSRLVFSGWYFSFYPSCAMISRHSDGELAALTVERLGIKSARGSTTRGGSSALKGLVRMLRRGLNAGLTPDGPKGPARSLQDGVVSLGQLSQRPVIPVSFSSRWALRLNSWDRFMIPLPFSRTSFVFGEPIMVPRKLDSRARSDFRKRIEKELNRVTDLADDMVGQPKI